MIAAQFPFMKNQNHPLVVMLKELNNAKVPCDSDPPEIQEKIKTFLVPNVDRASIIKASELISEGKNEKNILYAISLSFLFDSQKFSEFSNILNTVESHSKSFEVIFYYFVASWVVSTEPSHLNFYFELLEIADKLKQAFSVEMYNFIINILTLKYSTESKENIPISKIKKYLTKCTKENIYTFVDVLDKSIQSERKETIDYLLHTMTLSFEKSIEEFKTTDFTRLIKIIIPLLQKFDPGVLAMLAVLPKMTKQTELLDSFIELPSHTFLSLEETKSYDFKKATFGQMENMGSECSFSLISEYKNEGDAVTEEMVKIPNFDTTHSIQDLILPSHKYMVAALAPIIVEMPEEYSTSFFESFADIVEASKERFDLYIDFVSLITHPNNAKMTNKIFDRISINPVFTAESVFFEYDEEAYIVRSSIINNFVIYNHSALKKLLKLLEDTPFMYAEVIGIILTKLQLLTNFSFINHDTIGSTMRALDILLMLLETSSPDINEKIQSARKTIFMFIFSILENQATAYICFSSIAFATGFFSRVFEVQMKDLVLQSFSKVLTGTDAAHGQDLVPSIEFIGALFRMSKDQKLTDLLQCINSASMINNSLISIFQPIIEPICVFLTNSPSSEFLKQSLDFFLQSYMCIPQFSMTQNQIHAISAAIQLLYGLEQNESIITSIIGMCALSRSVRMPSMMILQRPELILLFLSIFRTQESTKSALLFIEKLCKHSIRNRIMCNFGEVDLLLLEAVKNYPNPFEFRSINFELKFSESDIDNLIFPIVTLIASQSSSPQVAAKFISLATPIGKTFPKFAINSFTAISKCISDSSSYPTPKTPLGLAEPEVFIHGITGDKIKNGFTAVFWLRVDVPYAQAINKHQLIFSLLDEGTAAIKVFISGSTIILKILTPRGVSSALLTSTFPSCQWSLVTLVYKPKPRQTTFEYIINGSHPASFFVSYPSFSDAELEVKLGGVYDGACEDENAISYAAEISRFAIYEKIFDFKSEISPFCTGMSSKLGAEPLFTYPTTNFAKNDTLVDAFNSNYRNIVPFFAYVDFMPPHLITLLLDILKGMVSASLNVDFCFIAFLLQQNNTSILTFSLWNKFFGFLEFISSNSKVAGNLMRYILASAELWHNAPDKELVKILGSWPALINFGLFDYVSFRSILSFIRIYFYYKPVETELIRPRRIEIDVDVYVQAILKVLKQHKMTEMEMGAIISHCASCPDTEQVVSILSLLSEPTDFVSIPKLLFYLLKPRKEDVFIAVIRALYNLTGDAFPLYVESVICVLKPIYCTYLLFDKLMELVKEIPLIYPLCVVVALSVSELSQRGQSEAKVVASALESLNIKPSKAKRSQYWIIWLALLSSKLCTKDQIQLVSFAGTILLDNFDIDEFENALTLLDIVSIAEDIDLTFFSAELTKLVVDLNLSNEEQQLKQRLLKICIKVLLMHNPNNSTSQELNDLYKSSPFFESKSQRLSLSHKSRRSTIGYSNPFFDQSTLTSNVSPLVPCLDDSVDNEMSELPRFEEISSSQSDLLFRRSSQTVIEKTRQRRKTTQDEQKKDFLENIQKIKLRKFCFCYREQRNLLQTTITLYESINQLNLAEKTICDFLKYIEDKEKHPMTKELYFSLFSCVDQFVSENKNTELLKNAQSRLVFHWKSAEAKAVSFSQLITPSVASIASGDVDNQLESINSSHNYMSKEWRILQSKIMNKSSPWSTQAQNTIFKKRFSCCGLFDQPLIKPVLQHVANDQEEPSVQISCMIVKIEKQTRAVFSMQSECFSIKKQSISKSYKYSSIQYILLKCPSHKPTACEILLENGKTIFIDFDPNPAMDIIQKLAKNAPNAVAQTTTSFAAFFKKTGTTQMWLDGEISNYEYLLRLNMFCGRSFRHPALYPIFPWIIIDFGNDHINVEQMEMFRDLKYPITAQTPQQRKILERKIEEGGECMYFTAPSNPTQVAHWLIRMEPFTTLHIDEEGGHFGCVSRLFKSMMKTTHQVLESANCWECTPEFYSFPEFLLDLNNTGLGDVELPVWAKTPFEFVYKQREALESSISSSELCNWIDLVFGIFLKKDTIEHFNSYNNLLHEDVWENESSDNNDESLVKVTLSKSGQLPPIIFQEKHPVKFIKSAVETKKGVSHVAFDRPAILHSVLISSESLLAYEVIFEDGSIESLFIDADNPMNSRGTALKKLDKLPEIIRETSSGLFLMNDTGSLSATLINSDGSEATLSHVPRFSLIESIGKNVLCVSNKGIVTDVIAEKELCTFLNDRVVCLAYSPKFRLVLCGTPSGQIVAHTTNDQYMFTIDLKGLVPTKILITESWGFIVVCCRRKLLLYNINGFFIREKEIKFDVSSWTTWSDSKGFDYIAISDPDGLVFAFEAFYLSPESPIHRCTKRATSINFVKSLSSIVLITLDSRCVFIPYQRN